MPDTLDEPRSLQDRVQSLRLPDKVDQPGRSGGGWLPWALCLLLALSTVSLAVRVYTAPPKAVPQGEAPAESAAAPAESASPARQEPRPPTAAATPGAVVLESKGYIIPAHQIQVSPIEVSGLVKELFIEEGKRFKKGEVLAVLDKTSFEADVADATAALASAEARLLKLRNGYREEDKRAAKNEMEAAEADLVQTRADFARAEELYAKAPGASITKAEWDAAHANRDRARRRYDAAQARYDVTVNGSRLEDVAEAVGEVAVAKARLRKAEWHLENCTIRAPVTGTVLTKKAELGNLVDPRAFGATSGAVCEMADLSDLEAELDITERDVAKVQKGMPCRVRAEAYPDRVYEGVVDRLMPIANRAKGAVPVRVKVRVPKDEEGVYLKPEMGAVVSFL
ncbi:MAG TPA: efflux RND transporter periplasmic adaptor subunit, partial [Gemmataceae bacterium]